MAKKAEILSLDSYEMCLSLTIFQITGNQNGHEASTTDVGIYNVRYIKIQSTGNTEFCLRIELCGEGTLAFFYYWLCKQDFRYMRYYCMVRLEN
jgi:hypothetical protein